MLPSLWLKGKPGGECREATLSRLLLQIFMKYRTVLFLFYLSYERKRAFRYAMSHISADFSEVIFPNACVFLKYFELTVSTEQYCVVQDIIVSVQRAQGPPVAGTRGRAPTVGVV